MPEIHESHLMGALNYETSDGVCIRCGLCTCHNLDMFLVKECRNA